MEAQNASAQNAASLATTKFGIALFKQETAQNPGKNILISPASVATALAMTMNGARSSTLEAIKSTLGFDANVSLETINASMQSLLAALADPSSGVTLNVANAIWAEQNMPFDAAFVERVTTAYNATVNNADFGDPATLEAINNWADQSTNGKIPTILEEIGPDMVMFLLNAIYFKGQWTTQFDKDCSWDGDFALEDGSSVSVTYMNREGNLRFSGGDNYDAVALPFGEGKGVSLYVIVPHEGVEINSFVAGLEASVFEGIKNGWETEVEVRLPRFQVEYDVDLVDSLAALGMKEAVSNGADFSGLAQAPIFISQVKHKTFAKFDEEGGEAAAVTSVGMMLECFCPSTPRVHAERPFVAALVDEETGTLLFVGKVAKPE